MGYDYNELDDMTTIIKVIGVGGGGGNAVNRMIQDGVSKVEFISMNTDKQVLDKSLAPQKVQLGERLTKGRGAGARPEIGAKSAEESKEKIIEVIKDAQMIFIAAGMGGGTGTGAASVIAKTAKELGILTVGIVTKPFSFEGKRKKKVAEEGIERLYREVDSLIVVPNDNLKHIEKALTLQNAFAVADSVLEQGVVSIASLINTTSFINLDFADICTVMKNGGYAHLGIGVGTGKDRAEKAAIAAINSPLLEVGIQDASGLIINIVSTQDTTLDEIQEAADLITDSVNSDANIIWGCTFDESLGDKMMVSIIATGMDHHYEEELNLTSNIETPVIKSEVEEPRSNVADFDDVMKIINSKRNGNV